MISRKDFQDYVIISRIASETNKKTKYLEVLLYPANDKIEYKVRYSGNTGVYPIDSFQRAIRIFNEL